MCLSKNKIYCISLFLVFLCFSKAHSQPTLPDLYIDTDGAPDDYRAINLFLASGKYNIRAIICTGGVLSPDQSRQKAESLVNDLGLLIPVIKAFESNSPVPDFRIFANNFSWGTRDLTCKENNIATFIDTTNFEGSIYVCLGPLTSLEKIILKKENSKPQKIIWYCNPKLTGSFNYDFDSLAAKKCIHSKTDMVLVSNLQKEGMNFSQSLMDSISGLKTPIAINVSEAFNKFLNTPNFTAHLKIWDDLTAVYLIFPELFKANLDFQNPHLVVIKDFRPSFIRQAIVNIFGSNLPENNSIGFYQFPYNKSAYRFDIATIADSAQKMYGKEEWKMCALTNEFHQHVGIYSIIGAKMGIHAREYFDVPLDKLIVRSNAGLSPPLSCLNDGLQLSTGATLGHGTISINENQKHTASAYFEYKGKKIKVSLKQELVNQVEKDIGSGIIQYGNLSDGYWKLIRELSLKYWLEWDRNKIFEMEILP